MNIYTITNNIVRKQEYLSSSEKAKELLARVPISLLEGNKTTMVGIDESDNVISVYFPYTAKLSGVETNNMMFSLKYIINDGSHYYKTYETGNTSSNPVDNVLATGKLSNSSNYTLYFTDRTNPNPEPFPLGIESKTYDENHNELFNSLYVSDVPS